MDKTIDKQATPTKDNHTIDFNLIKHLFGLKSKRKFEQYLINVYPDFYTKDEQSNILGVSKIKFIDFIKLPIFICEKFFYSINKHQSQYISLEELSTTLCQLYFGTLEETEEIIFNIYNFNHDGKIYPEDIQAILSFLPLKEDKTKISYKYQLESLDELKEILLKTFKGKEFLTFEEFCEAIKQKSDIFLQLLCYFYQRCSFKEENLKVSSRGNSGSKTQKLKSFQLVIDKEEIRKANRNYSVKETSREKNSLINSPQENTTFSPVNDFLMEGIKRKFSFQMEKEIKAKSSETSGNKVQTYNLRVNKSYPNQIPSYIISGMEGVVNLSQFKGDRKVKTESLKRGSTSRLTNLLKPKQKFSKGASHLLDSDNIVVKLINKCHIDFQLKHSSNIKYIEFPEDAEEVDVNYSDHEPDDEEMKKSINYEGAVYQWSEKKKEIKEYWLVLVGYDLTYYTNNTKTEQLKLKNLFGCFIKDNGEIKHNNEKYYSFQIIFRNKVRKYLLKDHEESRIWTSKLRVALEYKNFFDYYEMMDDIGSGSYGTVKLGVYRKTKQKIAIKIIQKSKLKPEELDLVINEIDVLKFCKHPNVINFLDHFENSEYIFIIMEYIKYGDLSDYLYKKRKYDIPLSEERAADISYQIADGLYYLHRFGILHRDLKLENIMISNQGKDQKFEIKILDFGLSKIIGPKETCVDRYGTLYYISPEIILNNPHNKLTDVWSYGVLVYFLLCNQFPFYDKGKDKKKVAKMIVKDPLEFLPEQSWRERSNESKVLIEKCLNKDQVKRIAFDKIVKDDWFKMFKLIK